MLTPGIKIRPYEAEGAKAEEPGEAGESERGGRRERPEELVPDLIRFLLAHPQLRAAKKAMEARMYL